MLMTSLVDKFQLALDVTYGGSASLHIVSGAELELLSLVDYALCRKL